MSIESEGLTAKEFKADDSGFYSKGLYLWLKKNPRYNRIYSSPWSFCNGYDPERPVLMVGIKDDDNWFHGHALRAVSSVGGTRQAYAYGMAGHRVSEWKDVTDAFIAEYRRIGKCHIHGDHAHEFKEISKTLKQCIHCKKQFIKKSKRVTKTYWEQS